MSERKKTIKSNLRKLDALSDQDIDYSDIAAFDEDFFKQAKMVELPLLSISMSFDKKDVYATLTCA